MAQIVAQLGTAGTAHTRRKENPVWLEKGNALYLVAFPGFKASAVFQEWHLEMSRDQETRALSSGVYWELRRDRGLFRSVWCFFAVSIPVAFCYGCTFLITPKGLSLWSYLHPSCLSLFLCLACTLGFFPSVSCAPPDCPLPSREQHSLPPPFLCPLHLSSSEIVSFLSFPSLYNWFLCGCQVLLSSHHVLKKNKQTQQGLPGPCCALKINLVFLLLLVLSRTQAQHPLPHDELTGSCHSLF